MENPLEPNPSLGLDTASYKDLLGLVGEQYKIYIAAKRNYVLTDFWEFSKEVIGWKDLYEELHKPMCDFVQDYKHKKRLMLVPRGHLKSSVVTVGYALWRIAQNPKIRILIANATSPLAITFLKQIKDHLARNEKFKELFGDFSSGAQTWSEDAITIARPESWDAKESTVTVYGIGGSLASQHYDVIILDDIVNRENIHTPDRIQDVLTFYRDVMDLRDNVQTSEVLVIGTRWHEADLYGWIMDEENPARHEFQLYERTAVEGEYQIVKDTNTGGFKIEGGTIIFPNKFTREGLEFLINDKGLSEFSSQYLNDPVPSDQSTFKHEFKYYKDDDLKGQVINRFVLIDPAFYDPKSKSTDLDYTVFIVVDVNTSNDWFIRDIVRARMQPKEILDMMFTMDIKWKPKTMAIESTAYQKILAFSAREMMRERNQFIPLTELKHAGSNAKSKTERIQALEPRYAVGSIKHNKNVRHIASLEMELRRFPRGKTDDCADCLANGLEVCRPPKKTTERNNGYTPAYPA